MALVRALAFSSASSSAPTGFLVSRFLRLPGIMATFQSIGRSWASGRLSIPRYPESAQTFVSSPCSLGDVMNVRRGGDQRMGDAAVGVNADVGFHAKVPLVAFLDLMHLGVSLAVFVLTRTRGFDDGGVDDGAFSEQESFDGQKGVDGVKDALSQLVGFQQAAELEQGGGIRGTFPSQVYANEAADGLAIVDSIFDASIGQTKALLGNVHAQHALYANRWSASADALDNIP